MRLLLDAHAFAYILKDDPALGRAARAAVASADDIFLCAVTVYEIGQKVRAGKWPDMADVAPDLLDATRTLGFAIVDPTPEICLRAALRDWPHRDPFDRLVAATAASLDLDLVAKDAAFATLPGLRTIW